MLKYIVDKVEGGIFLKKKMVLVLLFVVMAFLTGCSSDRLKFGTSGEGGTYGEVAEALADSIHNSGVDIRFDIRVTAGSAANVRLLSQDYLDVAIAQADIINDAYNGTGIFAGSKSYRGYAAVAGLYTEACQIVVSADSDIMTIDDLEGKKVSIGEAESGTEQNAVQILEAYGLNKSFVDEVNLNYGDACKQLKSGEIDAFFCTLAPNSPIIKELSQEFDIRMLSMSDKVIKKLVEAYDFYTEYTIEKGTYPNQDEDINTIGVTAVLLANEGLKTDQVKSIVESLFRNKEEINSAVTAELKLDPETAIKGISIPFHKGALEYYSGLGIDVD